MKLAGKCGGLAELARLVGRFEVCLEYNAFGVHGASVMFAENGVNVFHQFGRVHVLCCASVTKAERAEGDRAERTSFRDTSR